MAQDTPHPNLCKTRVTSILTNELNEPAVVFHSSFESRTCLAAKTRLNRVLPLGEDASIAALRVGREPLDCFDEGVDFVLCVEGVDGGSADGIEVAHRHVDGGGIDG